MNYVKYYTVLTLSSCLALSSFADESEGKALVKENTRGRWSFSAGPAWRSTVNIDMHGGIASPSPVARKIDKRDMSDPDNWTDQVKLADPKAGTGGIPEDGELWGVTDVRTVTYGVPGSDYSMKSSDDERPLGLNLQGCYEFYRGDNWSLGLNLRFAGYWNMKSSKRGYFNAGYTQIDTYTDKYVFEDSIVELPFSDSVSDASSATYVGVSDGDPNTVTIDRGSRSVSTRFRGDLYQIGIGPKAYWSPFKDWCEPMDWLDVYGGVEVLCNIAYSQLDADGSSTSSTDCLLGFGGNVGLVGNITDWCGIYGQVGYEWIDKSDLSCGGFKGEVDYSSLVLSAGLQFRF